MAATVPRSCVRGKHPVRNFSLTRTGVRGWITNRRSAARAADAGAPLGARARITVTPRGSDRRTSEHRHRSRVEAEWPPSRPHSATGHRRLPDHPPGRSTAPPPHGLAGQPRRRTGAGASPSSALALGLVVVAAQAGVALGGSPLAAPERRPASSPTRAPGRTGRRPARATRCGRSSTRLLRRATTRARSVDAAHRGPPRRAAVPGETIRVPRDRRLCTGESP